MASCCMVNWVLNFSPLLIVISKYENQAATNRARPSFYMISDNPNVSLGIVVCSHYTRRIALKDEYHKN